MDWTNGPVVGFDTETTGVDSNSDRIVTATVIVDTPGFTEAVYNWRINPGIDIPESASAVHGITTGMARETGMEPTLAVRQIASTLAAHWTPEVPLIIYNAPFDLTLMDRELARHHNGELQLWGPVVDPLTIDRTVDRYRRGKRTLSAVVQHYGVSLENAHASEADVRATIQVARAIAEKYPNEVGALSLDQLHKSQKTWYHNWAMNFASYLLRSAHELSADEEVKLRENVARIRSDARSWPMIPRHNQGVRE